MRRLPNFHSSFRDGARSRQNCGKLWLLQGVLNHSETEELVVGHCHSSGNNQVADIFLSDARYAGNLRHSHIPLRKTDNPRLDKPMKSLKNP